jgi:hypothetical protein
MLQDFNNNNNNNNNKLLWTTKPGTIMLQKYCIRNWSLMCSIPNESTSYCKHNPSKVLENNIACLYWDVGILIDKIVLHYRPDIILFEKTHKIFYLIDVSITNSGNLQTSYTKIMQN